MFGPYTPLQQLDLLADSGTKSYVVGSTNSLLLQQKDRYSDILINVSSSLEIDHLESDRSHSLTKILSASLLPHFEMPYPYLLQIGGGLIS